MLDVKKVITKILTMLKAHNTMYITETGTNNSWVYVKWSNKTYEAWRSYSGKYSMTSSSAGTYYNATPISISLPSFSTSVTNTQATPHASLGSGVFVYTFNSNGQLSFRSHASSSNADVSAYLYLRGTW